MLVMKIIFLIIFLSVEIFAALKVIQIVEEQAQKDELAFRKRMASYDTALEKVRAEVYHGI